MPTEPFVGYLRPLEETVTSHNRTCNKQTKRSHKIKLCSISNMLHMSLADRELSVDT